MVRQPDPESKTVRLTLIPRNGERDKIRAVKQICARNKITVREVLMNYGVETFLRLHNWPPGNSQTVLQSYGVLHKQECYLCHEMVSQLVKVEFISGLKRSICPNCLREDEEGKRLVRRTLL